VRIPTLLLTAFFSASSQEGLQERAREILRKREGNEITTTEARRRVQLLLKDLRRWAEAESVELETRTRVFSTPATGRDEPLTVDRCALFYEEGLEELCPLDVSRSETWGGSVIFCRYVCGPRRPPK
jgi:hypothetical protein